MKNTSTNTQAPSTSSVPSVPWYEKPDMRAITVYRDHPEWDQVSRWFYMRSDLLRELYVCTYDVNCDLMTMEEAARQVGELHPGHILIY